MPCAIATSADPSGRISWFHVDLIISRKLGSGLSNKMNIFRLIGDMSHLLAIVLLLLKMWKTRSCAGKCKQCLLNLIFDLWWRNLKMKIWEQSAKLHCWRFPLILTFIRTYSGKFFNNTFICPFSLLQTPQLFACRST